jgi:hypothetical protein
VLTIQVLLQPGGKNGNRLAVTDCNQLDPLRQPRIRAVKPYRHLARSTVANMRLRGMRRLAAIAIISLATTGCIGSTRTSSHDNTFAPLPTP